MKDTSIETMSFADLYAVHQYVKAKIEAIKEDHQVDPDEPSVVYDPNAEKGYFELTMVPEIGEWSEVLDKVEQEIEDRLVEISES